MSLHTHLTPAVRTLATACTVGLCLVAAPRVAAAQYSGALVTNQNNCVIPFEGIAYRKVAARVGTCRTDGGVRYSIQNGVVRTSDGLCLDHEVAAGVTPTWSTNGGNAGTVFVPCTGGRSQTWYFMKNGIAQNAANTAVCLDIAYGTDTRGTRILVWPCDYSATPRPNQRFWVGQGDYSSTFLASNGLSQTAVNTLTNGGSLTFDSGMRIVAGGGGNIIAAGGGNIVAGGGGNVVAAGAGNIKNVAGTTLIGQDGNSVRNAITSGGAFR